MSAVIEITNNLRGIEAALEEISNLTRLKEVIAKYKERNLSRSSASIMKLAIENISNNLNIRSESVSLSVESIEVDTDLELSLENIIVDIWEFIRRTFKALWDKLTYLFRSVNKDGAIREKESKKMADEVKHVVDDIAKGKKEVPVKEYLEDSAELRKVINALSYMEEEPDSAMIIVQMAKLLDNSKKLRDLISSLGDLTQGLTERFTIAFNDIQDNIDYDALVVDSLNIYGDTTYKTITGSFPTCSVKEVPSLRTDVDPKNVRKIDGFVNGGRCFCTAVDMITPAFIFELTIVPQSDKFDKFDKLRAVEVTALESLLTYNKGLTSDFTILEKESSEDFEGIRATMDAFIIATDALLKTTDKDLKKKLEERRSPTVASLKLIKEHCSELQLFITKAIMLIKMQHDSVGIYNTLCKLNLAHYKIG